jgi:type I restriction enzyme, S subunit
MAEMQMPHGYKQTEVGVIPEDWEVIDLARLCTLQRGFDITEATRVTGTVPVYSSSGLAYYHNKAMVSPPGVVTGRKGILGKVFLQQFPLLALKSYTTLSAAHSNSPSPAYDRLSIGLFPTEQLKASVACSNPLRSRRGLPTTTRGRLMRSSASLREINGD